MEIKLTLEARSPLVVGGKKLGDNYNRSLGYVPGSVVRAAVARAILDRCPYFDPAAEATLRYWVTCREAPLCAECAAREWCRVFGRIVFRDALPAGTRAVPLTALQCKRDPDHPLVDTLLAEARQELGVKRRDRLVCPVCGPRSRLETAHADAAGPDDGRRVNLRRQLVSRVSLDRSTRTSARGNLYTLDLLSDYQEHGRLRLEATFSVPDATSPTPPFTTLRVGGDVSGGAGKLVVAGAEAVPAGESAAAIAERVQAFNRRLGLTEANWWYFSLTLASDADLGLAERLEALQVSPAQVPTHSYLQLVGEALAAEIHPELVLVQAFLEHEVRRGWDTSRNANGTRRPPALWTRRGSVFLARLPAQHMEDAHARLALLEREGLGRNRETGCGQVVVCDPFHLQFASEEG